MQYFILYADRRAVIVATELFLEDGWVLGGETMAANILLFILGFTSMTTVYEIAKTGKHTKSDKINRAAEPWKKKK